MLGQANMNTSGQMSATKAPEFNPGASFGGEQAFPEFPAEAVMPVQQPESFTFPTNQSVKPETYGLGQQIELIGRSAIQATESVGLTTGRSGVLIPRGGLSQNRRETQWTETLSEIQAQSRIDQAQSPAETSSSRQVSHRNEQAVEAEIDQLRRNLKTLSRQKPNLAPTGLETAIGVHTNQQESTNKGIGVLVQFSQAWKNFNASIRRSQVAESALFTSRQAKKGSRNAFEGAGEKKGTDMMELMRSKAIRETGGFESDQGEAA